MKNHELDVFMEEAACHSDASNRNFYGKSYLSNNLSFPTPVSDGRLNFARTGRIVPRSSAGALCVTGD